ncbi:glyoxylate/hydroxypyruvate reductase-like protein [Dothidotthia symphoricarpi CBS 119687]|uniref:Glyoxylate/hydroxypyruvate reductase-like protein n=1 Tax=Dothidotthia symphoricarpi CBS 119687 TaxID=1392245 RepID=A0A6A6AE32_9PLEO|nr:glyoxylate/hydroxypyruvate reductase-like protein [Dothidotthia symphoricarpi CBS 119687]KAF2129228.1 glyoxylate/hydroxypyruvate reductase-like protein [Dothidotthia symphoricarpi CBS 119687]
MQRLSQLTLHLSQAPTGNSLATTQSSKPTPPSADHNDPANTNTTLTMAKTKIVVTRQLFDEAQSLLDAQVGELELVQWQSAKPCDRSWLLENAQGATGILVMLTDKVDEELLTAAGDQLKAIASFSVGTDHVDRAALKKRNIRLGYTPTCLTDAVADLTVMLILMAQRRGGESIAAVVKGDWPQMAWHPLLMTGPQIRGTTVGFLGFGRIAQASLHRLLPFGIKRVLYLTSKPGQPVKEDHFGLLKDPSIPIEPATSADQLASESDIVIVGCALTPSTKHIISTDFFSKMKKLAVIVNIARGPVIDTEALVKALDEGQIFGAGLDVIENEPNIQADHPILKQPRCVLVPHIGSATIETRQQMATESVKNLLAGLTGEAMVNELDL